jgi:hypothetical protein
MIDADLRTLHIRCGSDLRDKLRAAGFTGDFLEYSDPVRNRSAETASEIKLAARRLSCAR